VVHFQHPPIPSLHTTIMLMHASMLCVYFNLEWQSWNSSSRCCHEIAKLTSCFTNGNVITCWILFVFGSITNFTYIQCCNTYVHQAYLT
jgi:membrane-associated phospholipid phosphatase